MKAEKRSPFTVHRSPKKNSYKKRTTDNGQRTTNNIVLVGFMGTGKTVVGKRLAQRLNMEYVDVDELIEQREGRKINDIFAKDGEPYFRKVEKKVTRQVSEFENVVIATGGGVVLDDENIRNLKTKGVLICLSAQPEIILERTKRYVHRPLLNVADPEEKIAALLKKRAPYYAKADFCLDTSNLTIEEVAERIISVLKRYSASPRGMRSIPGTESSEFRRNSRG